MTVVNVSITRIPRLCLPVRKNQNPAVATPNRQHDRKHASGSSGDSLPPSPPAEKATACQEYAGQPGTNDRDWDAGRRIEANNVQTPRIIA